jgi:sugar phosphate isomerase/epimerase
LRTSTTQAGQDENKLSTPRLPSFGVALCPKTTPFAPLLFTGQLAQGFQAAADAGFQMVELSLRSGNEVNPVELTQLLQKFNLSISAIATGRSFIEDSLSLTDPNAEIRGHTILRIKEHIQFASGFDAAVIIGGIRGKLKGTASEQSYQRQMGVDSIRKCAQFAREHGVILLIEPLNRYETNFINTASEGIQLLDEISEPSVRLALDTFHMNIEEVNISASIQSVGNRLGYIHFADSNRLAPGQGHTDFAQVMHALTSIHYQGVIAVEILPIPDDTTAIRQAGAYLRKIYFQS